MLLRAVPCGILHIHRYPGKAFFRRLVRRGDFFFRKEAKSVRQVLGLAGPGPSELFALAAPTAACFAGMDSNCPVRQTRHALSCTARTHRTPALALRMRAFLSGSTLESTAPKSPLYKRGWRQHSCRRGIAVNSGGEGAKPLLSISLFPQRGGAEAHPAHRRGLTARLPRRKFLAWAMQRGGSPVACRQVVRAVSRGPNFLFELQEAAPAATQRDLCELWAVARRKP